MEIFFLDPSDVPLPPDQVRIREFRVVPWPEGRRVHVYLEVDPFQKRPDAEVVILTPDQQVAADITIIETMTRKMEFNMHLRQPGPRGTYLVKVTVYYPSHVPDGEGGTAQQPGRAERLVVDMAQVDFSLLHPPI